MINCEICDDPFQPSGRGLNNQVNCVACRKLSDYGRLKDKNKNLKRNMGITYYAFQTLFKAQNASCAVCEMVLIDRGPRPLKGEPRVINQAVVDHCHETGEIRGLLCHHCNVAVGHVRNSSEIALRMGNYLKDRSCNTKS